MRLDLGLFCIRDVQLAGEPAVRNHVRRVNCDELRKLPLQDVRFCSIAIELARPGEKCRIIQVAGVIEPRAKTGEVGEDIPGVVGAPLVAGQ